MKFLRIRFLVLFLGRNFSRGQGCTAMVDWPKVYKVLVSNRHNLTNMNTASTTTTTRATNCHQYQQEKSMGLSKKIKTRKHTLNWQRFLVLLQPPQHHYRNHHENKNTCHNHFQPNRKKSLLKTLGMQQSDNDRGQGVQCHDIGKTLKNSDPLYKGSIKTILTD